MVSPSNLILLQNNWTAHCWLFNPLSKKFIQMKKSSLSPKWSGIGCCHSWLISQFSSERIMSSKSKIWSWKPLETQRILDQLQLHWFFENHWIITKGRNALLFLRETFLESWKLQFPRERVTKLYWSISAGSSLRLSELKQQKTIEILFWR